MQLKDKVQDVQRHLQKNSLDGWLLYDFHGRNELACDFLEMPSELHATRRFFYWIPSIGEPVQIVHAIETNVLERLTGANRIYLKWEKLEELIEEVLKGSKRIAMEYSPRNALPYISKVDAGVIDLVRSFGVEVVSSADFLQYFTCVLSDEQLGSHMAAAKMLDKTVAKSWQWISDVLKAGRKTTEYDVQQFILQEFAAAGFITEGLPICAVNAHSASPHYEPNKVGSSVIKEDDFVLIDLWCKQKHTQAVYADICRVGVVARAATGRQKEIFSLVRKAQKNATDYVKERYGRGEIVKGCEVDMVSRKVIVDAGYGDFFPHRTGHNIYTEDHGPGTHIDSLETLDERPLITRTCFSIEPGIYLPNEFGVRLEYDVYLEEGGTIRITGGIQDEIVTLL